MGYIGYSKSERAVGAEFRGLYPATVCARMLGKGVTARFVRDVFKPLEWHHTSKFYNATDYYSLEEIQMFLETPEGVERLQEFKKYVKEEKAEKKAIQSSFKNISREKHLANCEKVRALISELCAQFKVLCVGPFEGSHGDLSRVSRADFESAESILSSLMLDESCVPPYSDYYVLQMDRLSRDLQSVADGKSIFVLVFRWNCLFFVTEKPSHIRLWSEIFK